MKKIKSSTIQKCIALIIAVLTVLGTMGITAFAENYYPETEITLNGSGKALFTPEKPGWYTLEIQNIYKITIYTLYDEVDRCFKEKDFEILQDSDGNDIILIYISEEEEVKIAGESNSALTARYEGTGYKLSYDEKDADLIIGADIYNCEYSEKKVAFLCEKCTPVTFIYESGRSYKYDTGLVCDGGFDENPGRQTIAFDWLNNEKINITFNLHSADEYIEKVELPKNFKTKVYSVYDGTYYSYDIPDYIDVYFTDGTKSTIEIDRDYAYGSCVELTLNDKKYELIYTDRLVDRRTALRFGVELSNPEERGRCEIFSDDVFYVKQAGRIKTARFQLEDGVLYLGDLFSASFELLLNGHSARSFIIFVYSLIESSALIILLGRILLLGR